MSHQNSNTKSIKRRTSVALIQISHVRFMQPLPCFAHSTNGNMTDFAHFHCMHLANSFVVCSIVHCIVDHESSSSSSSSSFFLSFFCVVWKDGGFLQAENCIFQLFACSCANFQIRSKSRMPLAPHPCGPSGTWGLNFSYRWYASFPILSGGIALASSSIAAAHTKLANKLMMPILPFSLFTKLTYLVSAWGSIMAEWLTWALLYQHTIS